MVCYATHGGSGIVATELGAELAARGGTDDATLGQGASAALAGLLRLLDSVRGELAKIAWSLHGKLEHSPVARY